VSESDWSIVDLANTIALLSIEPPPSSRQVKRLKKRGGSPIEEARLVFEAAVEYVTVRQQDRVVGCWRLGQARLEHWEDCFRHFVDVLRLREPTPTSGERPAAGTRASLRVNPVELEAILLHTGYRQLLAEDIDELLWLRARRFEEAEKMRRVVAAAHERVLMIMERYEERRSEISQAPKELLQPIWPSDPPSRKSDMDARCAALAVLTDTACAQIDAQTRRVLDGGQDTTALAGTRPARPGALAAMPVWQFREMAYKDLIEG
jgi:hypothetical protein